ncbi:MAG TPA: cytochrome c [Anaerolineae bacterium]|nr:cytochrome c [Anaerolineae bacterium]
MKKTVALAVFILLFATGCDPRPVPEAPTPIRTLFPATLPAVVTQPPSGTEVAEGDQTPEPGQPTATAGDPAVAAGEQVFAQNCSVCHNLTAEAKVGPGLAGLFERDQLPNGDPVTDENLRVWITNGGGAMPPVPLPEDELTQVIAFLHEATQ